MTTCWATGLPLIEQRSGRWGNRVSVPSGKTREATHTLKAIHAQENRAAAREKAEAVIAELHRQSLGKAADLVAEHIAETLTY